MVIEEDATFIIKKTRRGYIVIRKNFPYEFHSHFDTLQGCKELIMFFNKKLIPDNEYFCIALQRITTDYEFSKFTKKHARQKYKNRR